MTDPIQKQEFIPGPKLVWFIRIILLALFIIWVAGAIYLHQVVKADEAAIAQREQVLHQQEERARRAAAYERSRLQEQMDRNTSKNVVDGFKR